MAEIGISLLYFSLKTYHNIVNQDFQSQIACGLRTLDVGKPGENCQSTDMFHSTLNGPSVSQNFHVLIYFPNIISD